MFRRAVLLLYCLSLCTAVLGQANKKAERYYNAAIRLYAKKQKDLACKNLELAIEQDPAFTDAYLSLIHI